MGKARLLLMAVAMKIKCHSRYALSEAGAALKNHPASGGNPENPFEIFRKWLTVCS
jgi:hypothetical protein